MIIGNKEFKSENGPYIMGILNCTPDSFSDGGLHNTIDSAMKCTEQMIEDGASIIDIGGESTRPGHVAISEAEEMERTLPVIEKIKSNFDITVSLDTYKSAVAEAGLKAGADMINDIWGLKWDGKMADIIAKHAASCCIMHNRKETNYVNFLKDVSDDLDVSMQLAYDAGIDKNRLMVDPGIGFAKDVRQNRLLMNHLEILNKWGVPVLLGTSRKSMIGLTLDLPVTEREEGTVATSVIGLMKGCDFFRVHNVRMNKRALDMAAAILRESGAAD